MMEMGNGMQVSPSNDLVKLIDDISRAVIVKVIFHFQETD